PYRSASSCARSGRRAVASSRSTAQPERSSPDRSTSPILPAPMTATVCISAPEEDLGLGVPLQRYRLQLAGTLDQRYPDDLGTAQGHHPAEVALVHRVDRLQPEPGGEYPVERGRRAAAPDVSEHD